jgi:hypothetical protein
MSRFRISIAALVALGALVAAGCGGGDDEANATTQWADGLCSAVTTWQDSLSQTAQTLKEGGLSKDGLSSAVDDAKSATDTLIDDVKGLGKPDTDAGQQAKDSVDQLTTSLQGDLGTIESAVSGASGVSGVLSAVSVVSQTLVTMGSQVTSTVTGLQSLDAGQELQQAFDDASSCDSLTSGS